jgi:hypothetical protein
MVVVCPSRCYEQWEDEGGVRVDFDGLGPCADLAPADGFVWPCTAIGSVELLPRIDVHGVVRPVALLIRLEVAEMRARRTKSMELAIWCLHTPPPRMTMPAFLAYMLRSLILRMSCTRSMTSGVSAL